MKVPILTLRDEKGNEVSVPAIRGKSAYAYAVDGGYTGTEAEFSAMLAGDVIPTISVTAIAGGHRITITDKNGTKTVDVMNGVDGEDGADGKDGATAAQVIAAMATETWTFTLADGSTVTKVVPLV